MGAESLTFSWRELAAVTGGRWLLPPGPADRGGVTGICDDSRKVEPGNLFVAIRGEFADGHRFLDLAVAAGAAALCIEPLSRSFRPPEPHPPVLVVPNSLAAFQALAHFHRQRCSNTTVIGLTGSCGKTSTKEMLACIFEAACPGQVHRTMGNWNNHFGVPRCLLGLRPSHRIGVFELGTNHPGEIAALTELVRPDIGLVTHIGRAHLEFLGDTAGVAREKGALLAGTKADGTVVIPAAGPHRDILEAAAGSRCLLTFGETPDADVQVVYRGVTADGDRFTLNWNAAGASRPVTWNAAGRHQALNAACAAAAATAVGIDADTIAEALAKTQLPHMRIEVSHRNGVWWISDAYNANPDSTRAALEWLAEFAACRRLDHLVLVLGDMLELGPTGAAEHRAVLRHAREQFPEARILAVGPLMSAAAAEMDLPAVASAADAKTELAGMVAPGAAVLLKASRGIGLEYVLPGPND